MHNAKNKNHKTPCLVSTRPRPASAIPRWASPDHTGNGGFGGFLPTIAFAMVAAIGDIHAGLWCPIGVAVLPETFRRRIEHRGAPFPFPQAGRGNYSFVGAFNRRKSLPRSL